MKRRGLPKYVSEFQDRHGKWRTRARRKCWPTHYFAAQPGTDEFWAEYRAWRDGERLEVGIKRTRPGSINDVIARYYRSVEWTGLAPSSQTTRRYTLERFREEHGDKPVAQLKREHVQRMVEAKSPAAGRHLRNALRALMKVAIDTGYRRDDPTQGVKTIKTKSDGYHSWTEDEIAAFEATHPIDSRARLAFAILLYSGQRRGDVIRMGRQHVRSGRIHVRQKKTGAELGIKIHPHLQAVLDAHKADNLTFLVTRFGKPYSPIGFSNWFRACCDEAGLSHCSAHGLRKAAARRLAEAGCSASQIAAVTGHKSLQEVERYTQKAAQMTMADAAIAAMPGTEPEQRLANLEDRLAKSGGK
jgi:integrase